MATTDKEVLKHLFEKVLKLDEADQKLLRKDGYWRYSKFTRIEKLSLEKLHDDNKITVAC